MGSEVNFGGRKSPDASKKARRSSHLDAVRKNRRQDAEARDAYWGRLSPLEQLAALDMRLGKGVGAVRQRETIAKRIEAAQSH
jgi:hypothetical protein